MIWFALTPLLVSLALGVGASRLSQSLSGRTSAVLLTTTAMICALSVGLVLSALGCLALAEWHPLAELGHWSTASVSSRNPLPVWVDSTCGVLAVALLVAALTQLAVSVREIRAASRLARALTPTTGELVITDDVRPDAFVLAGPSGRIVVTRSMLRALTGPQRRALLAHEASHARHHHYVYVALTQLAAAANPLLLPVRRAAHLSVERWADEDAARDVDDRHLVATTLATAGLARGHVARPPAALAAAAGELLTRIGLLTEPSQGSTVRSSLRAGVVVAGAAAGVVTSAWLGLHLHALIEWAQAVDVPGRH